MEINEEEPTSESLKEKGNSAIKENNFKEAILYYTQAIKLDSQNFTLFSNRSLAHLKLGLFYLAMEDAKETIALNPTWAKGYFRKGEVEFATKHFENAYESYKEALKLKPDDNIILEALNNSAKEAIRQKEIDKKIPWVGAGVGIVIGVVIVIAECIFTSQPTHPLLMALVTIVISLIGYVIARLYKVYNKQERDGLLEPPPDLCTDDANEEVEKDVKKTPRYTKSQARLRYKKGKL